MTYKEQLESKIVSDKLKIDAIMQPKDGEMYMQHKALPYMLDLYEQMNLYSKEADAEVETSCMIYMYLADNFTYIPYLPLAVSCYTCALECAKASTDKTIEGEIPELIYKIAKYRNMIERDRYYAANAKLIASDNKKIYDDCADIDTDGKVSKADVKQLIEAAAETASRGLLVCANEHTKEYLEVICDMNDTLLANLEDKKNKKGFCHAYWAAKKVYLHSKGIEWESPAKLNPGIKFD